MADSSTMIRFGSYFKILCAGGWGGASVSEFTVFPVGAEHRIMGIGCFLKYGKRYFAVFYGNHSASCLSM
jgi:hypothetical protein